MPLYNESENVHLLYSAIVDSLKDFPEDYEMIFIDDGSSDNTREVALDLANSDRRLKLVIFRKNFGQTPAMAAGIDHARGSIIVTMDGDMQIGK